jgi:hypothetical protein
MLVKQGVCDAIGDGISIQYTDFMILYQNQAHKEIMGDHIGEYCYKAYEKKEDVCEGCPVAMSFKDGKVHTTERTTPTDKGSLERKKILKSLIEKMEELVMHYKISGRIYKVEEITKEIEELTSKLKGDKK